MANTVHRTRTAVITPCGRPILVTQPTLAYKLVLPSALEQAKITGYVAPSALDEKDGYIHLSTDEQYMQTANLHYKAHAHVIALRVKLENVEGTVKWEAARDGSLFPHLYGTLPLSAINATQDLHRGDGDVFSATPLIPIKALSS